MHQRWAKRLSETSLSTAEAPHGKERLPEALGPEETQEGQVREEIVQVQGLWEGLQPELVSEAPPEFTHWRETLRMRSLSKSLPAGLVPHPSPENSRREEKPRV